MKMERDVNGVLTAYVNVVMVSPTTIHVLELLKICGGVLTWIHHIKKKEMIQYDD